MGGFPLVGFGAKVASGSSDNTMTISLPANSGWTANGCRWRSSKAVLPVSPVFSGGVLLTPQRFLKDIPRVTPDGFWS